MPTRFHGVSIATMTSRSGWTNRHSDGPRQNVNKVRAITGRDGLRLLSIMHFRIRPKNLLIRCGMKSRSPESAAWKALAKKIGVAPRACDTCANKVVMPGDRNSGAFRRALLSVMCRTFWEFILIALVWNITHSFER